MRSSTSTGKVAATAGRSPARTAPARRRSRLRSRARPRARRAADRPCSASASPPPASSTPDGVVLRRANLGWTTLPLARSCGSASTCPCTSPTTPTPRRWPSFTFGDAPSDDLLLVRVGKGVGAGLLIDGELFTGSTSPPVRSATSRSTTAVTLCACGRAGCLETDLGAAARGAGSPRRRDERPRRGADAAGRAPRHRAGHGRQRARPRDVVLSGPADVARETFRARRARRDPPPHHPVVGEDVDAAVGSLGDDDVLLGAAVTRARPGARRWHDRGRSRGRRSPVRRPRDVRPRPAPDLRRAVRDHRQPAAPGDRRRRPRPPGRPPPREDDHVKLRYWPPSRWLRARPGRVRHVQRRLRQRSRHGRAASHRCTRHHCASRSAATIRLWLNGEDTRTSWSTTPSPSSTRCTPTSRSSRAPAVDRPRREADHVAVEQRQPRRRRVRQHPGPGVQVGRRVHRPHRQEGRARRRRPAAEPRRGGHLRRQALRRAVLRRRPHRDLPQGPVRAGRHRGPDHARRVRRGRRRAQGGQRRRPNSPGIYFPGQDWYAALPFIWAERRRHRRPGGRQVGRPARLARVGRRAWSSSRGLRRRPTARRRTATRPTTTSPSATARSA